MAAVKEAEARAGAPINQVRDRSSTNIIDFLIVCVRDLPDGPRDQPAAEKKESRSRHQPPGHLRPSGTAAHRDSRRSLKGATERPARQSANGRRRAPLRNRPRSRPIGRWVNSGSGLEPRPLAQRGAAKRSKPPARCRTVPAASRARLSKIDEKELPAPPVASSKRLCAVRIGMIDSVLRARHAAFDRSPPAVGAATACSAMKRRTASGCRASTS
jgi:hypothetical protein